MFFSSLWSRSCFSPRGRVSCPHIKSGLDLSNESSPSAVLDFSALTPKSPGSFHLPPFGAQLLWETKPCESTTWRRYEVLHLASQDHFYSSAGLPKVSSGFSLRWVENLSEVLDQSSLFPGSGPSWILVGEPTWLQQQSRSPEAEWPSWVSHPIRS